MRWREVRDEFDLSASHNLIVPAISKRLSVWSEYNKQLLVLLLRLREVRALFNLSASDNLITPSVPIALPVSGENEIRARRYRRD
jgi:hypothetical protein